MIGTAVSSHSYSSLGELRKDGFDSVVAAIGVFDGIHLGHRKLLTELCEMAERHSAHPVAMTFYPHPRVLVDPKSAPELLLPPEEKVRLLKAYGAETVVTIPFTKSFAALSPDDFLNNCLFSGEIAVKGICVGKNWKFGARAAGNTAFLEEYANRKQFDFCPVKELKTPDGMIISSSAVRKAVSEGKLTLAESMLGRHYALYGTVERGYRMATETLEAPTANLRTEWGVIPPNGVYAAFVWIDGKRYSAAVNIGVSPTFRSIYGSISRRIEIHVLDGFQENLYDKYLSLELAAFIREETAFPSPEALKKQIRLDLCRITEILKRS